MKKTIRLLLGHVVIFVVFAFGSLQSFQAIAQDTIAPTAICQDITVELSPGGLASVTAEDIDNGSFDNVGIDSMFISQTDFDCGDIGNNQVVLTVLDAEGNAATCTSMVSVLDTTPPTLICGSRTYYLGQGGSTLVYDWDFPQVSYDSCSGWVEPVVIGIESRSLEPIPPPIPSTRFFCEDLGVNYVTLIASDQSGNQATCTVEVTILDTFDYLNATANCKDISVYLNENGEATINPEDIDNNSARCGVLGSLEIDIDHFTCGNVGPNTVTLTVTDTLGNVTTCQSTITVIDTFPPAIECRDTTMYLDEEGDAWMYDAALALSSSSDSCGIEEITVEQQGFGWRIPPPEPLLPDLIYDCNDLGENTVVITVIDVNGNTNSCISTVTVLDTIQPEIVCKDTVLGLGAYLYNDTSAYGYAEIWSYYYLLEDVSDNCGYSVHVEVPPGLIEPEIPPWPPIPIPDFYYNCTNIGPNEVYFMAIDVSGNATACTTIVTVVDTQPPFVMLPEDIIICANNQNGAFVSFEEPFAIDNCGLNTMWQVSGLANDANYPLGTTMNIYEAVDIYGNAVRDTFRITVEPELAPQASFIADESNCAGLPVDVNNTSIGENLTYNWDFGDGSFSNDQNPFLVYDSAGIYVIELEAINATGCISVFSDTVILYDELQINTSITDVSCNGSNDGLVVVNVNNGAPLIYYSLDGSPETVSNTFENVGAGWHTFVVSDANGCEDLDTLFINEPEPLDYQIEVSDSVDCENDMEGGLSIVATGGTPPYFYSVDGGNNFSSGIFDHLDGGTHSFAITDANGCGLAGEIEVPVITGLPVADFEFLLNGLSIDLINNSIGAESYHWNFGDGFTSNEFEPDHIYLLEQSYSITLVAINDCGSDTLTYSLGMLLSDEADELTALELQILPNPNKGSFTLQVESSAYLNEFTFRLWSVQGSLIAEEKHKAGSNKFTKNFSYELAQGVYTVELILDDRSYRKKLIAK